MSNDEHIEEAAEENGPENGVKENGEPRGEVDGGENAVVRPCMSPFQNTQTFPTWVRYGMPLWIIAVLILLLNSDIGSGVTAESILIQNGKVVDTTRLIHASIFTSVRALWDNGSYPLAVFIVVTSVSWPYVKLLLSLYSWFSPYRRPNRRMLVLEVLDFLGKWSLVDIVVFVIIMVAFR